MHKLQAIYETEHKKLLIIPFALLFICIGILAFNFVSTGEVIERGIGLKGGTSITVYGDYDLNIITEYYPKAQERLLTGDQNGARYDISIDANQAVELREKLVESGIPSESIQVESIGSSLGDSFFRQLVTALCFAFLLMSLVVFIYFRSIVPSLAVILSAFSDIVCTAAIFSLFNIPIDGAGVAALLMLIGYSVDTDILLTSRMLKDKKHSIMNRIYSAMRTGLTMAFTTITVVFITLILVQSEVVKQIVLILFIGLLVDLVMTWIQNAILIRLHLEAKK